MSSICTDAVPTPWKLRLRKYAPYILFVLPGGWIALGIYKLWQMFR